MKVVCNIRAFYNNKIIKPGEVINIKGKKCPTWAKEVCGEAVNEKDDNKPAEPAADIPAAAPAEVDSAQKNISAEDALEGKTDSELAKIADELLTKAVEKNIMVDISNKTLPELIKELQVKLKEAEE